MPKITEYEKVQTCSEHDVLLIDGALGTRTIEVKDIPVGNTPVYAIDDGNGNVILKND